MDKKEEKETKEEAKKTDATQATEPQSLLQLTGWQSILGKDFEEKIRKQVPDLQVRDLLLPDKLPQVTFRFGDVLEITFRLLRAEEQRAIANLSSQEVLKLQEAEGPWAANNFYYDSLNSDYNLAASLVHIKIDNIDYLNLPEPSDLDLWKEYLKEKRKLLLKLPSDFVLVLSNICMIFADEVLRKLRRGLINFFEVPPTGH